MQAVICPLPWIADLQELFANAHAEGGITLDAELCHNFAEGLADIGKSVEALRYVLDHYQTVERIDLPDDRPRTPTERRLLAAMATQLDPEGRVVAFPIPPVRFVPIAEGGSAA